MFQDALDGEIEKKQGKFFGPPGNCKLTVFFDDMSIPFVNEWNDQITLEIMRQLIELEGYYFLNKENSGDFKNVSNLQYLGAMNHPGSGRNDIPNRVKRFSSYLIWHPHQWDQSKIFMEEFWLFYLIQRSTLKKWSLPRTCSLMQLFLFGTLWEESCFQHQQSSIIFSIFESCQEYSREFETLHKTWSSRWSRMHQTLQEKWSQIYSLLHCGDMSESECSKISC